MACLDVMKYIKLINGTLNAGITYNRSVYNRVVGYRDANYATDSGDRKSVSSQSRYAFTYTAGMISWKSEKQPIVALSTSESELVALDSAAREAIWITVVRAIEDSRSTPASDMGR